MIAAYLSAAIGVSALLAALLLILFAQPVERRKAVGRRRV